MNRRLAAVCLQPGCICLVVGAPYCVEHTPRRLTRTERGYTNDWLRTSREVLQRDGYRCHYCGGPASSADHVIAKARGGSDDVSNLVSACRSCNSRKGAR